MTPQSIKPWLVGLAVLACGIFFAMFSSESVDSYRAKLVEKFDQDLARPENPIRKRIESAHVTVKSTGARVSACSVTTVDGSNKVGKNYSNINDVDVVVTVFWEGMIQKDGYTEIRMVFDPHTGHVKTASYVGGNALFNVETIDWFQVGQELAPVVMGLL